MASITTMPNGSSHCRGKRKPLASAHHCHEIVIGQPLDIADAISVDVRLDLFEKVLLAPRQVSGDMADNDEPRSQPSWQRGSPRQCLSRRHSTDDDEEIFRLAVKRDLVQIDGVINDRERFVSPAFSFEPG